MTSVPTCTIDEQALRAPDALGAGRGSEQCEPVARRRIIVQQRQRLFREGISQLLAAESDVEVLATATTDTALLQACQEHRPGVVLLEADANDWDPLRVVAAIRRLLPKVALIGLAASPATAQEMARARRAGIQALVSRDAGITGILVAVRAPSTSLARDRASSVRSVPSSVAAPTLLTTREIEVLSLVGAGLTSNGVSGRLQISHKTVENHKQRIFAKLGVQNQAHAVSVAMRTGLIRPDRVIDLAVGD